MFGDLHDSLVFGWQCQLSSSLRVVLSCIVTAAAVHKHSACSAVSFLGMLCTVYKMPWFSDAFKVQITA
jgi:hypothetical protein